jgi:hypothetical protein
MNVLRVVVAPIWLVTIGAMIDCFAETAYSTGIVGFVSTVAPLTLFLIWPFLPKQRARRRARKQSGSQPHRRLAERVDAVSLAQRADWENQAFLHGDPRGVYGQWMPPPIIRHTTEGARS